MFLLNVQKIVSLLSFQKSTFGKCPVKPCTLSATFPISKTLTKLKSPHTNGDARKVYTITENGTLKKNIAKTLDYLYIIGESEGGGEREGTNCCCWVFEVTSLFPWHMLIKHFAVPVESMKHSKTLCPGLGLNLLKAFSIKNAQYMTKWMTEVGILSLTWNHFLSVISHLFNTCSVRLCVKSYLKIPSWGESA